MKWINESEQNPGHSVYHATPGGNPDILYVIRQKRKTVDFTPTGWRVFVRSNPKEPLRTIYFAAKLSEAKAFVADWENVRTGEGQ